MTDIEHRDGLPWFEAPLPPRIHRCSTQTSGWVGLHLVVRCACGAIRRDSDRWWSDRNSRRRDERRSRRPKPAPTRSGPGPVRAPQVLRDGDGNVIRPNPSDGPSGRLG